MNKLVVTRHPAMVQYLKEIGIVTKNVEVVTHASEDLVTDRDVVGVLPHSLSCLTRTFTEVPLFVPAELRGTELTIDQIRTFCRPAVTYKVTAVSWP